MQFKQGVRVYTFDGKDVGKVDRVVIDPPTREVSHLVIQKGFLFTEDKVVPISLIASATDDRVALRQDAGDLANLPTFEEMHYIPLTNAETEALAYPADYAPGLFWYPPTTGWTGYSLNAPVYYPPRVTEVEKNIPEDTVALQEGARVLSADGKHVGNIERVLTGPVADRVSHFVISQGLILKERKVIPYNWVSKIEEDTVHLGVNAAMLDRAREYQES
ncbi:MAG TPA: PRC-barrel domain-containing protein [Phototrophicaceae bacterium]|nr:PRC-barrel domain-containing protein [Phototrophicaceae bacterium]